MEREVAGLIEVITATERASVGIRDLPDNKRALIDCQTIANGIDKVRRKVA